MKTKWIAAAALVAGSLLLMGQLPPSGTSAHNRGFGHGPGINEQAPGVLDGDSDLGNLFTVQRATTSGLIVQLLESKALKKRVEDLEKRVALLEAKFPAPTTPPATATNP